MMCNSTARFTRFDVTVGKCSSNIAIRSRAAYKASSETTAGALIGIPSYTNSFEKNSFSGGSIVTMGGRALVACATSAPLFAQAPHKRMTHAKLPHTLVVAIINVQLGIRVKFL